MTYQTLIIKSLTALVIINAVLLVYGAVVLIDGGHWGLLRFGIAGLALGRLILPYTMLPGVIAMGLRNHLAAKKPVTAQLLFMLSFIYFVFLFTGFATLSLSIVHEFLQGSMALAAACWAVASGVGPWVMVALADRGNYLLIVFLWLLMPIFAAICWFIHAGALNFGLNIWLISAGVMLIGMMLQNGLANYMMARDTARS